MRHAQTEFTSKRNDLRENILANKLNVLLQWVVENRPVVVGGLGFIVLAALISSVFVIRNKDKRELNWTRLSQAQAFSAQKRYSSAKQILSEIQTAMPNDAVGLHALFYLAEVTIEEGNYDEAKAHLNSLIDKSKNLPLHALAIQNLGFVYEQQKDYALAAQTYQKFLDQYGEHFMAPRIQLALGRTLALAGKPEEAKKTFNQLIDLYPTSEWAEKARSIMDKNTVR